MSSYSSVHIIWRWPNCSLGHQMSVLVCKLELDVHFIWKYELIFLCTHHLKMTLLLAIRCHYWGVNLSCLKHFIWKYELILLWTCHLKMGGKPQLHLHFIRKYELILGLTLASQRSFLQKTNTNHSLYKQYMDKLHDLTVIIFTELAYENKALYTKFYQVLSKQQEIFNKKFCFSLTWLSSNTSLQYRTRIIVNNTS